MSACQLSEAIGSDEATAERMLPVVSKIIEAHAPDAPSEVMNEAAIRYAGYLRNTRPALGLRKMDVGSLSVEPLVAHGPAFRNCGAAALLMPFRLHRGGLV